jgi:hypothetical protein
MLAERLIARIRGQLELNTPDLEARSLAGEYASLCLRARERLEQCATLLRSGNEHAAFQVAESEPDLLGLCALLSFAEADRWQHLCRERGLPPGFPLDGQHILAVESLYGKEIGESHPLYRDYRDAIRKRDEDRALSVLRSIARINPNDPNARSELSRLSAKFLRESLGKVTLLFADRHEEEAIELMNRMERFGANNLSDESHWGEALQHRTSWLRSKALQQVSQLATEAAEAHQGGHWEACAASLGRARSLERDHQLNLPADLINQITKLEAWAGELATAAEAEAGLRAGVETLTNEWNVLCQESARGSSPAILIVRLNSWLERAANLSERLPEGVIREARALRQNTRSKLSRRYTLLTTSAVAGLIALIVLAVGFKYNENQLESAHDQLSEARRLIELYDHPAALKALHKYENEPNIAIDEATRREQTKELSARIAVQNATLQRLSTEAHQLHDIRQKGLTIANLAETTKRVEHYQEEFNKAPGLQSRLKVIFPEPEALLAACRLMQNQVRTDLTNQRVALHKAMGEGENITDITAAVDALDKLRLILRALTDGGAKELDEAFAEADRAGVRLDGERKTVNALRALRNAADIKSYLEALADTAKNTVDEKSDLSKRAAFVAEKADTLRNLPRSALAPRVGAMWDAAATADPQGVFHPTDVLEPETRALSTLSDDAVTASLHRYTIRQYISRGPQILRIALITGEITEKRVPITDGFEITQRGKELNRDGAIIESTWSRREFNNGVRAGEEAAEQSTIKELEFIRQVARFQDPKTGKLLEPLIRTMDRIRRSESPYPELRAYQLQELYKLAMGRPEIWGVLFSPSAQRDAEQLRRLTQNSMRPLDFLFKDKWADIQKDLRVFLIRQGGATYSEEARFWRATFATLRNKRLILAGMVGRDGQPLLREQVKGSTLYGLDNEGKATVLFRVGEDGAAQRIADAAPLSPLLRYPSTVAEAAEAATIPKGLLPPDGGWETLLQGRDL